MKSGPTRILLLGLGRCGSSAISETLEEASLSHDIGECAEAVFGCYHAIKESLSSLSYAPESRLEKSALPRRLVNLVIDLILEDRGPRPLVTAKCIGVPSPIHRFIETHGFEYAAQAYIDTLHDSFSTAWKWVFMARDPETWIPSAMQRWGISFENAWEGIYLYSEIIRRMVSRVTLVLFEDLQQDPARVYEQILNQSVQDSVIPGLVERLSGRKYATNPRPQIHEAPVWPTRSQLDYIQEIRRASYKNYALVGLPYRCFSPFDYFLDRISDTQDETPIDVVQLQKELDDIWSTRLFYEKQSELFSQKLVKLQQQNATMESWIRELQTRLGIS